MHSVSNSSTKAAAISQLELVLILIPASLAPGTAVFVKQTWWLDGDRRLSRGARKVIADDDNAVLVSAVSAWEISTKVRLGKLPGATEVAAELPAILRQQDFDALPIAIVHALRAGNLPEPLRDPLDRMLIAQAQDEDLALVSNERIFDAYGVRRLW